MKNLENINNELKDLVTEYKEVLETLFNMIGLINWDIQVNLSTSYSDPSIYLYFLDEKVTIYADTYWRTGELKNINLNSSSVNARTENDFAFLIGLGQIAQAMANNTFNSRLIGYTNDFLYKRNILLNEKLRLA